LIFKGFTPAGYLSRYVYNNELNGGQIVARLIFSVIVISMLMLFGCSRYQNTHIALSAINDVPIKYRIGNLESKHSKELNEFMRSNYGVLLTENEDAPVINASFINIKTSKPSVLQNFVAAFSLGFVKREFSVDVRCVLQTIKDHQILSESKTEGTGKVESWGYFAAFREHEDNWGIGPAELEAEKRALSSAIEKAILGKK
jgi:hypothetical protein